MALDAGSVYYTIEADTSSLVNGATAVDKALDAVDKSLKKTDKEAKGTEKSIVGVGASMDKTGKGASTATTGIDAFGGALDRAGKGAGSATTSVTAVTGQIDRARAAATAAAPQLTPVAASIQSIGRESDTATSSLGGLSKVLGGLLTLQGANSLIQMAEAYNEMAERIGMATSSAEEYDLVQQRLLKTANGTYRALAEAQEVYILTADSLRSMGYTTDQVLDITDSLSYAFVKNAASTQRADTAISAYTKSIQTGKVAADSWQSIIAAAPSIIGDIATATGKTTEEIRKMGAEGKLTAQMISEGSRQSYESNKAAADGMATTVKDAFTNMRTNLSAYIGEANRANGATGVLSSSIELLGDNIDVVVKLLMAAGAGALAKYIAQLGATVIASGRAMLAARAQAAEELRLAQAHAATTAAALAQAQANVGLAASTGTATAAAKAHQAALAGVAAASGTAASAGATLMAVLGGPAGIIALIAIAATGMYLFSSSTADSTRSLLDMDQSLDSVIEKVKDLTESQRTLAMESAKLNVAKSIQDLDSAFDDLNKGSLADGTRAVAKWRAETSGQIEELVNAAKSGSISYQELDTRLVALIRSYAEANGRSEEWISQQIAFAATVSDSAKKLNSAETASYRLGDANRELAGATGEAADQQNRLNAALAGMDGPAGKYLKSLEGQIASLEDGNSKVKEATRLLKEWKDTGVEVGSEVAANIMTSAIAADKLREAQEKGRKSASSGASASIKAAKEQKTAEEQSIKVLDALAQSLMQAGLGGEQLAVAKARASLNSFATPGEVAQVEALARALWAVGEVEKAKQKFGDDPMKYIEGSVSPLSGGAFDDQTARYEAEAVAEQERYAAQLVRLQDALELQKVTKEQFADQELAFAQTHADRMAQIEQAKTQVLLKAGENGFGAMADMMRQSQGEQSGIYKAMFAASKAFAIANSIVAIQAGIAEAAKLPFPANLAAMATVAANTAGIISTISSTSLGGGRQYGGPVAPGAMHRINENGAPEILNTANGRQYLLPNSRGEVVSNKDAQGGKGGAAPTIIIQQIQSQERAGQIEQSTGADQEQVITMFVADIRGGGKASQAIERTYGLNRRGS